MTKYIPRAYADIKAIRQENIRNNVIVKPKGRCHMCDCTLGPKALWCSTVCASDYAEEQAMLTSPVLV